MVAQALSSKSKCSHFPSLHLNGWDALIALLSEVERQVVQVVS